MEQEEITNLVSLVAFFKQLMRENIAYTHTTKDLRGVNWRIGHRSYLEMATVATDAAFRDLDQALIAQNGVAQAIARLASLYQAEAGL